MSATGLLFYDGRAKPLSATGTFQSGCYLYFYTTGTTTQTNVYADGALTVPLSQPVTAASDGRFVPIYLDPTIIYRYQLYNAAGSLLEDVDPFVAGQNLSNYVTSSSLTSTLSSYVTSSSLATSLASYATTADLSSYAPLASPALTGTPTAPTAAVGTSTTQLATTAFVAAAGGQFRSGTFNCANGTVSVTFATAFPNTCKAVCVQWAYSSPDVGYIVPGSVTVNGFSYTNGNAGACYYIATGT